MFRSHHPYCTRIEHLPFIVHYAETPADYAALCELRVEAYSRHNYTATLSSRLARIDEFDRRAVLLMATCKSSKKCIGTLRVSVSTRGDTPRSEYEHLGDVEGQEYAYIDRFAVELSAQHIIVRKALMKAMWLLVCELEAPWVVASALAPLARLYRSVGLRAIPGAERGFKHPKLHDTALYYMVGGCTKDLHHTMYVRERDIAEFFSHVLHPDIPGAWPPAYMADPATAPNYLTSEPQSRAVA